MSEPTDNLQSLTSLTVLNATAALERGLAAIKAGQTEFDLRHVLTVDSVAVSVLLSWQRAAQEAGLRLKLQNLPPALQSLTKLYGVCSLVFPDQAAPAEAASGLASAPADLHHH
jgi:phospholipid transport system transporter-binding protein